MVHGQIILNQFKHFPNKAIQSCAFVNSLKCAMEARKHSKLYSSTKKAVKLKTGNRNPMKVHTHPHHLPSQPWQPVGGHKCGHTCKMKPPLLAGNSWQFSEFVCMPARTTFLIYIQFVLILASHLVTVVTTAHPGLANCCLCHSWCTLTSACTTSCQPTMLLHIIQSFCHSMHRSACMTTHTVIC